MRWRADGRGLVEAWQELSEQEASYISLRCIVLASPHGVGGV